MKYGYSYDRLGRLTDAVSTESIGNATYAGRHEVHLTYDKLGNPLTIIREGVNADDGSVGLLDNATLSYDGNQMLKVTNNGFHDKSVRQKLFVHKTKFGLEGKDVSLRKFIENF